MFLAGAARPDSPTSAFDLLHLDFPSSARSALALRKNIRNASNTSESMTFGRPSSKILGLSQLGSAALVSSDSQLNTKRFGADPVPVASSDATLSPRK